MELVKHLVDHALILTPRHLKESILETISKEEQLLDYKLMSDQELKNILYFEYDPKMIVTIANEKKIKPAIAKEYLHNLYYIDESKTYPSLKLKELAQIKRKLMEAELIKENVLKISELKSRNVVVYGFDYISKEMEKILSNFDHVHYVMENPKENKWEGVYEFTYIEDEVDYVFYEISKLLKNGVDINHIYIANANEDYSFFLNEYSKMYNVPIEKEEHDVLFSLPFVQEYIHQLKETNDYGKAYELILKKYPLEIHLPSLLSIINQFVTMDVKDALETFIYTLKNIETPKSKKDNIVRFLSLENQKFEENDYVFVLSINQGIYPKNYKNEDFLSDDEKQLIGIDTSTDLNKIAKEQFMKLFQKEGHFYLSYKLKSSFANYVKAFIIETLNLPILHYNKNVEVSFSFKKDELDTAIVFDDVYKETDDFKSSILCYNYTIPYRTYDNQFTGVNKEKVQKQLIDKKINLSYSALNNYYQCGFKYYLNNLLKMGDYKGNSAADIGTLFHEVLQHYEEDDTDFDQFFDNKADKIDDISTRFYARKLKETLRNICIINKENHVYTKLTNVLCEKKVEVYYDKPIKICFKGIVDKIMCAVEGDKTYVAIIDYKTGNPDINLKLVDFGLSLQLPIYLYLVKHTDEFKNVIIAGFYLQKLLNDANKAGEDEKENLRNGLKLQGYSNSDLTVLMKMDSHYEKSEIIKSMSLLKSGEFNRYAKVLSNEEIQELTDKVEQKVQEAIERICNGDFAINPKIYDKKNVSCQYCSFKTCCFTTFKDRVYLNGSIDNLEEEGGDE